MVLLVGAVPRLVYPQGPLGVDALRSCRVGLSAAANGVRRRSLRNPALRQRRVRAEHQAVAVLSVAYQGALADLEEFHREGRLGDNLPRLVVVNAKEIPADLRQKIGKMIDESNTGVFDTHPCDKDRIIDARREKAAGVFTIRGRRRHCSQTSTSWKKVHLGFLSRRFRPEVPSRGHAPHRRPLGPAGTRH